MTQPRFVTRAWPVLIAAAFAGHASAAGFALLEQNASGIGNAYAGTAAAAEDASTVFFNPAGMALLPAGRKQFAVSFDAVRPSLKFSNAASALPSLITTGMGNGGDAGGWAAVPAAYLVLPIDQRWSFGIGLNAPFGLATEYDSNWIGRFQATKSEIQSINLNPSVSFKASDTVALGFGLNYQTFKADLNNAVDYSAAIFAGSGGVIVMPNVEGTGKVKGDDSGWGWNAGAVFQPSPGMRIGVAYRSSIKYELSGDVTFSRPATGNPVADGIMAAATPNGSIRAWLKTPDNFTLSVAQQLNDRWEMLGDLSWTGWSKIPKLEVVRTNGALLSSETLQWRDTWRVALGGSYRYSDQWRIRIGIAYDQSPVGDQYRTARLPDNNRTWLTIGAQYRPSKDAAVDFGYAYIWVKDASINNNRQPLSGLLNGNYKANVQVLGVQYSQSF